MESPVVQVQGEVCHVNKDGSTGRFQPPAITMLIDAEATGEYLLIRHAIFPASVAVGFRNRDIHLASHDWERRVAKSRATIAGPIVPGCSILDTSQSWVGRTLLAPQHLRQWRIAWIELADILR